MYEHTFNTFTGVAVEEELKQRIVDAVQVQLQEAAKKYCWTLQ